VSGVDPSGMDEMEVGEFTRVLQSAVNEMQKRGLSAEEISVRHSTIWCAIRANSQFDNTKTFEDINPKLWKWNQPRESSFGKEPFKETAINIYAYTDIFGFGGRHGRPNPRYDMGCKKFCQTVLIGAQVYCDISGAETSLTIQKMLRNGESFSRDAKWPNTESAMKLGYPVSKLVPGDQVWFQNPYCYFYTSSEWKKKGWGGYEGSNTFYVGKNENGDATFLDIYRKKLYTYEGKQAEIANEWQPSALFRSEANENKKLSPRNVVEGYEYRLEGLSIEDIRRNRVGPEAVRIWAVRSPIVIKN